MQASDENKEKYQIKDYHLIQYQILLTNIRRIVWQTVRRITNEVKTLYLQGRVNTLSSFPHCEQARKHTFSKMTDLATTVISI